MNKLKFEFTILPGSDEKTNIFAITSIGASDNKIYAIPEELQAAALHKEITGTSTFAKIKNSLKKRYQVRRVWVTMTDELESTYIDEDGNLQFDGQYLEEIDQKQSVAVQQTKTDTLEKLFEKVVEKAQEEKPHGLKHIVERFVIEKFTSKNTNADHWIDMFEKECERFEVKTDEKKIEILRLFMDKSCADWYTSMIMKLTMNSDWSTWRTKFCETFANKGWKPVTYALQFRYKEGLLLDYAIKKEKLVLEMRRSIDTGTLIDLIAAGLPEFVLNRIDREILKDTVDLFNEVGKYEHMVNRKSTVPKNNSRYWRNTYKNEEYTPCKICEKLSKGSRYHPEDKCWFKTKEEEKNTNKFKHVNNAYIETELNQTTQKN